jgi:hypothetical protein
VGLVFVLRFGGIVYANQAMEARRWVAAAVLVCLVALAGCQELPLDGNQATAALSFNPSSDPFGNVDTYKMLQKADIEGQWSKDDGRNATEKMEELLKFSSVLHIDVKLVGFDGDGNYDLKVDEADFLRYFETVLEEHEKVIAFASCSARFVVAFVPASLPLFLSLSLLISSSSFSCPHPNDKM